MKIYTNLFNIFLALVAVSQLITWMSSPFSGYVFMRIFLGLALLCLGAYGIWMWKKLGMALRFFILVGIFIGTALLVEYEPIAGYLLR